MIVVQAKGTESSVGMAKVKFDMRVGIDCSHVRKEIGKD